MFPLSVRCSVVPPPKSIVTLGTARMLCQAATKLRFTKS
jgi:hypothetical protein